jgi:hypothetical protein
MVIWPVRHSYMIGSARIYSGSPRKSIVLTLGIVTCLVGCASKDKISLYSDGQVLQARDGRVYLISHGKRRYIPDPGTLDALGLRHLISADPSPTIDSIPLGEPLPSLPGRVIQNAQSNEVFLLEAGKRRYIPDPETLAVLGLTKEVRQVPASAAESVPLGPPMPHAAQVQRAGSNATAGK